MNNPEHGTLSTAERELLENGVYVSNTIGHSMEPFLSHHRDTVVISSPEGEIRKYDVVLYPAGAGRFILHRVIAVRGDTLVIRGDNTFVKEYVPREAVIGVLCSFTRRGKRGCVTDRGYRLYARFWSFIYPLRAFWRSLRHTLGRARRKLFGKRGS